MSSSNLSMFQVLILASLCFVIKGRADKDQLKFENRSESLVKGCFNDNNSLALCFEIRPGFLKLTDKQNRLLVTYRKLPNQTFHAQVLDDNFVWHHSTSAPMLITPGTISNNTMHTTLYFASGLTSNTGLNSPALYQRAMKKLQTKKEMQLLERTSHALQDSVNSYEISKPFHLLSMSLLAENSEYTTNTPAHEAETADSYRQNSDHCEDLRKDPYNNKCMGMCGLKCWCWPLLCGDCCSHKGCHEHDLCCGHQRWSGYCLLPFFHNFRCEGYGGYPACLKSL